MGGGHQVLLFDGQVMDGDYGQVALKGLPRVTAVEGNVHAGLCTGVE